MKYYKTTEQITKTCEYNFKLPEFGKSTTDPTYYEPAATRIANMRKSAQSAKSLYDFDGTKFKDKDGNIDWSKQDISDSRIIPGRKPGLTREEISQHLTDTQDEIFMHNEEINAEKVNDKKQINQIKNTLETLKNEAPGSDE